MGRSKLFLKLLVNVLYAVRVAHSQLSTHFFAGLCRQIMRVEPLLALLIARTLTSK